MSEKVTYKRVTNANVAMDNSVNESKTYDISANVSIGENNALNNIDNGYVVKDGVTKANFNRYSENNINVQFYTSGVAEMCEVATAIDSFVNDVCDFVNKNGLLSVVK